MDLLKISNNQRDYDKLEAIKTEVAKLEKAIDSVYQERQEGKASFINYYNFLSNIKNIID